jgi:sigma-E factor negative regulatory protein RseB
MLWLYWRRLRLAALAVGLSLGTIAALVIVSGSLAGPDHEAASGGGAASGSGAQLRQPPAPVANLGLVRRGVSLMSAAVAAGQSVSYHGIQMVAWWGSGQSSAYLIQVWHQPGQPELTEGDVDGDAPAGSAQQAAPAGDGHVTAGVLSLLPWMLALLRSNYVIEYAGTGTANDRPAQIVTVRRKDGSLAARYWLDQATNLPVRREMFDARGHLVNEGAFIDLSVGASDPGPVPGAQAWSAERTGPGLARMRSRGWPVPRRLAGDMALVALSRSQTGSGLVVDASYSDGMSVVSVFMQHGVLPKTLPGWQQAEVRGQVVYSSEPDERSIAWSAHGIVFTVISDAPQDTVQRIVTELPHNTHVGLWTRVGRGLKRIGSWFNPFG